ncbi:hypothetical protein SCG7086_AH_00120 [Chlamydiales bacterium SCGC AG-110-P3]|nr:hypothetical protein SCG7086_AH_00120 [Chlamydiales bacterium SCGC AG-110-P3]
MSYRDRMLNQVRKDRLEKLQKRFRVVYTATSGTL